MAKSPAHRWGQIIGDVLEEAFRPVIKQVADSHGLYFDYKRKRAARRNLTVAWTDQYGNAHLLDYVLERAGTDAQLGLPVAFIETAFRRYTKHSKNKAQEIEGAVVPLADTYSYLHPFRGAILGGVFTGNSLTQLRSRGFDIIYIPYDDILKAFEVVDIDASCQEETTDVDFQEKVDQWDALSPEQRERVRGALVDVAKPQTVAFVDALNRKLARQIQHVTVTVLHGRAQDVITVLEAIQYIEGYSATAVSDAPALKFDVQVRYNNGDIVGGVFHDRADAVAYLQKFL
jgi:hypothetical protein